MRLTSELGSTLTLKDGIALIIRQVITKDAWIQLLSVVLSEILTVIYSE